MLLPIADSSQADFSQIFNSAAYTAYANGVTCKPMSKESIKRWSKISLRTLHLLAVAGVGGGILFGLDKELWLSYWWLALATGAVMMLIDMISNPVWLLQVRGLTVLLKLILVGLLGRYPGYDSYLLVIIIVISAVISHAPGKLRYYSVYHRKILISSSDTKG